MSSSPPSNAETESARRYVSDVFAIRMETIGSIADLLAQQATMGSARRLLGQLPRRGPRDERSRGRGQGGQDVPTDPEPHRRRRRTST
jgi:hypothetical protein